jgi:hypothetical protein
MSESIYDRFSLDNFPNCFKEYADLLTWYEYWDEILDTSDAPCFKWFKGGKINASYNCIDRHLAKKQEQDRHSLRSRTDGRGLSAHHLPGALCPRE